MDNNIFTINDMMGNQITFANINFTPGVFLAIEVELQCEESTVEIHLSYQQVSILTDSMAHSFATYQVCQKDSTKSFGIEDYGKYGLDIRIIDYGLAYYISIPEGDKNKFFSYLLRILNLTED